MVLVLVSGAGGFPARWCGAVFVVVLMGDPIGVGMGSLVSRSGEWGDRLFTF